MLNSEKAFSGFSVDNIQKAKKFYGDTLGLPVSETGDHLQIQIANGAKVFVYQKSNHTPATFTILNFPVDSVEKSVEDLSKRGVRFQVYTDGPLKTDEKGVFRGEGPRIAWFKDPAGNFLSILEPE